MVSVLLVGTGVAGAIGPPLTVLLRNVDPRVPFALCSAALLVMATGLLWAEKHLARVPWPPPATPPRPRPLTASVFVFYGAVLLLGLEFQLAFAFNAPAQYLRFAKPAELQYLLPVFWAGLTTACPASAEMVGASLFHGYAGSDAFLRGPFCDSTHAGSRN